MTLVWMLFLDWMVNDEYEWIIVIELWLSTADNFYNKNVKYVASILTGTPAQNPGPNNVKVV